MDEIWYLEVFGAANYKSELTIQKFKMAQQCRQCVVTGCSRTTVDVPEISIRLVFSSIILNREINVPLTWNYVYCISASSAFGSEATSCCQNAAECRRRIELSCDTTCR